MKNRIAIVIVAVSTLVFCGAQQSKKPSLSAQIEDLRAEVESLGRQLQLVRAENQDVIAQSKKMSDGIYRRIKSVEGWLIDVMLEPEWARIQYLTDLAQMTADAQASAIESVIDELQAEAKLTREHTTSEVNQLDYTIRRRATQKYIEDVNMGRIKP